MKSITPEILQAVPRSHRSHYNQNKPSNTTHSSQSLVHSTMPTVRVWVPKKLKKKLGLSLTWAYFRSAHMVRVMYLYCFVSYKNTAIKNINTQFEVMIIKSRSHCIWVLIPNCGNKGGMGKSWVKTKNMWVAAHRLAVDWWRRTITFFTPFIWPGCSSLCTFVCPMVFLGGKLWFVGN